MEHITREEALALLKKYNIGYGEEKRAIPVDL